MFSGEQQILVFAGRTCRLVRNAMPRLFFIHLPQSFYKGNSFYDFFAFLHTSPFSKEMDFKRKDIVSGRNKFLPFRVDPF